MLHDAVIAGPPSALTPFDFRPLPCRAQSVLVRTQPIPDLHVAGGRVEMIFETPVQAYSSLLITLFMVASVITILSLLALIFAPIYANERIAVFLYCALAAGLGALALIVRRAQIMDERGE